LPPPRQPGDLKNPENASLISDLVSPDNFVLVKEGMRMNILPTERSEWPPPYREATEKYSARVSLAANGTLKNCLAGQFFPLLDPNDPEIALKVIWNFSLRPGFVSATQSSGGNNSIVFPVVNDVLIGCPLSNVAFGALEQNVCSL